MEEVDAFIKALHSSPESEGTAKAEKSLSELAKTANDLLTRLHKSKRSLNTIIYEMMGSSRGIKMLKELNEEQLSNFIDLILSVVTHGKLKDDQVVCLRLLSNLIYDNCRTRGHVEKMFFPIVDKCKLISEEPKTSRQAFNCLGNLLCLFPEVLKPKAEIVLSVAVAGLHKVSAYSKPEIPSHTKQIQSVVRCLSYSLSYPRSLPADALEELFAKLYRFLFLGTPYANFKITSSKSGAHTLAAAPSSSSSGSEISDTDETESSFDKYGKVRVQSLICIQQMCRLNSKFMFEKWHLLLSRYAFNAQNSFVNKWELDEESVRKLCVSTEPHILALMHLSKDPKVKSAAAATVGAVIEYSPMKTWQGSLISKDPKKKLSHLTLSEILGNVIINLHYILPYYLESEEDSMVRAQVLKSISLLLAVTQYQKIPEGLIEHTLSKVVWKQLKDDAMLGYAINCFTSVANQKTAYAEFEKGFLNHEADKSIIRFVLELGLENVVGRSMDCLTLLSKVCKNYSQSLQSYWPMLWNYINLVLKDEVEQKTLGSIGFIEEYIKHHNELIYMNQSSPFSIELFESKELVHLVQTWVQHFLSLKPISQLQTALIDLLGAMSEVQWQRLDGAVVGIAVSFVMSLEGTGTPQAVALKAIGNMVTYKMFNGNSEFVNKVVNKIIGNRSDGTMMVGMKNSWALANLCYCLENFPSLGKSSRQ
eukprot:TRINITY_DN17360_c0_g1_i2.p1 TRINITY_DN17360_c0_g1~~TRINITY_DN17360_c0_g1_i2.p1  ORF type:complete len:753 (-),score=164.62 TRINITY_DN17360_c0_g1_i2:35-2149(-)